MIYTAFHFKRNFNNRMPYMIGVFLLLLLSAFNGFSQPLKGTYTIGATDADFRSYSEAVSRLTNDGLSGQVIFKVKDGIYNEQLTIPFIQGATAERNIIFESVSGKNSDVVISFSSTSSKNYTVLFDKAKYIEFRNHTFKSENTTYGAIIRLVGECSNIKFLNNNFNGISLTRSNQNASIVSSDFQYGKDSIVFKNNIFNKGQDGILIGGSYDNYSKGIVIENNIFSDQYLSAVQLSYLDAPQVRLNNIYSAAPASTFSGIYISNCRNGATLTRNSIRSASGRGIYTYLCAGSETKSTHVANNMISVKGSNQAYGIYNYGSDNLSFFNNNVLVNSSTSSYAIYSTSDVGNADKTGIKFYNNILTNYNNGYVIYFSHKGRVESDYNNLLGKGENFVSVNNLVYKNPTQLKENNLEVHSISVDPAFVSYDDLHARKAMLKGAGISLQEVTEDFDGELRLNPPCIGADEFTPAGLNAELAELLNPQLPFSKGEQMVSVKIRNAGAVAISSLKVNWKVNDELQTPFLWNGSVAPGKEAIAGIGKIDFKPFVPYNIKVWVSNAKDGVDFDPVNDTLVVSNIYGALLGTYTISKTSGDFKSIDEAVNVLNNGGVLGPVVFNIDAGTYTGQYHLKQIAGSSFINTVTFQTSGSAGSVVLENQSVYLKNYIFNIDKSIGVTFKNLILRPLNSTYSASVRIQKGSSYITFDSNKFEATSSTSSSSERSHIIAEGNNNSYDGSFPNRAIVFKNNTFSGGTFGLYFPPYTGIDSGLVVFKNKFENQYSSGIRLLYQSSCSITENIFSSTSSSTDYAAVSLSDKVSDFYIENNKIAISAGRGIYIYGSSSDYCRKGRIANNFVSVNGTLSSRGIILSYISQLDIAFNNIYVKGAQASSYNLYITNADTIKVYNNIFYGDGSSFYLWNTGQNLASDYNCFYLKGEGQFTIESVSSRDFNDFKKRSDQEKHSIYTDPLFKSATDLHVNKAALKNGGKKISGISTDIDGEQRSDTPCIGADEFTPEGNDVQLVSIIVPTAPFSAGEWPLKAVIKNQSFSVLTTAKLSLTINSTALPDVTWSGSLNFGGVDTIDLGKHPFSSFSPYTVTVSVHSPNGGTDVGLADNTFTRSDVCPALKGIYTIGGGSPEFESVSSAIDALNTGGVLGEVTFKIRSGTYNGQISIRDYPGSSCANKVAFKSETEDSTSVIIKATGTSLANYVLQLNKVKGVTIKGITLKAEGATYARTISMVNGSSCNIISGNVIESPSATTSDYGKSVIYYSQGNDSLLQDVNNGFYGNLISGGSYGIAAFGNSTFSNEYKFNLEGNKFLNQYNSAVVMSEMKGFSVSGNTIKSNSRIAGFTSGFRGVIVEKALGYFTVNENKIEADGIGIYISNTTGDKDRKALLANNFVVIRNEYSSHGILTSLCSNLNFYHNSVNVINNRNTGVAFQDEGGSGIRIFNNNFVNSGGGTAIHFSNFSPENIICDYNNLYTSGSNLGVTSEFAENLSSWKALTGTDIHSVSLKPEFVSEGDLHVTSSLLKRKGLYIPELPLDIDHQLRNTTAPDIGADEYPDIQIDAAISKLVFPSVPFSVGQQDVKVSLSNDGLTNITSVVLNWSVNNVLQPAFTWSGSLQSGEKKEVIIGKYDFVLNVAYKIVIWSSSPNGQPDQIPSNDSLSLSEFYASMSGSYTIGKDSSDFQSFTSAISALEARGVAGPVVFNIKSGTYNEQFTISRYPGSSCENTVTFQSQSGDSTSVVLAYTGTSASNYILKLSGSKGVIVKNLTFLPASSTYSTGILLETDASCNRISGNIFRGSISSTSTTYTANLLYLTGSPGSGNDMNVISGNYFEGAGYGIYFNGYATPDSGNVLNKNVFSAQYYRAIHLVNQTGFLLSNNEVKSRSSAVSNYAGISFTNSKEFKVSSNKIVSYGGEGILLNDCRGSMSATSVLENNFISNSLTGISLNYSDYINVYHNTVLIRNGSVASSRAFNASSVKRVRLFNNIFSNAGAGNSVYLSTFDSLNSDYNVHYTMGQTLVYANINHATLSDWQQASLLDEHSFAVKPVFQSDFDLHTRDPELDNKGILLSDVKTDIDGEARNSAAPDLGADEFSLPKDDAGITKIISQKRPFRSGNQDVVVNLVNMGLKELRSVIINWSVNDIPQNSFSWNGNLSEHDSSNVTIGKFDFQINQGFTIKAWTTQPNGNIDGDITNDSVTVKNIYPGLNGVYSVGKTNSDFSSLASAIDAVVKGGLADSVVFNLTAGTYNEQISIPRIQESSVNRPLIIQSVSGKSEDVTIEFTPTASKNYVLQLNDADHIHFRNLTLKALESEYTGVVQLYNNADSNSFLGNILKAPVKAVYSYDRVLMMGKRHNNLEVSNDGNKFINNQFLGGSYGVALSGYGGTNKILDRGIEIRNNVFKDQYTRAVWLDRQESVIVENNNINFSEAPSEFTGIDLSDCSGSFRITENRIAFIVTGLYPSSMYTSGIHLEDCSGDASVPAIVSNNIISIGGNLLTYGIYLDNASNTGVYHNSVNVWNTFATSSAFSKSGGTDLSIYNNIFANTGKGLAAGYRAISATDKVNYNCYYSIENKLVSTSGNIHTDIKSWRNVSGHDANSLQLNPVFRSAVELRVREAALKDRGTYITAVPKDIDGDIRSSFPDIGADEFIPESKADAGLIAFVSTSPIQTGKNKLKVLLRNYGADTLKKVTIAWTVNNFVRPSFNWTGSLASGKEDTVTVAEMDFFVFNEYNLKFWPLLPNGISDTVTFNDTISVNKIYTALKGIYTIGGNNPDFGNFAEAASALNNGGVAGPVTFNIRSGLYSEKVTFKSIKGAGPNNQILFQSEANDSTKVILNYNYESSSDKTLVIDSSSYLTFSKLTISASGLSGRVIAITGNATNITFSNNIIKATENAQSSAPLIEGYGKIDYVRITDNKIINGGIGVSLSANDVNNSAFGILLVKNIFENQNNKAIRLSAFSAPTIKGNRIETNTTKAEFRGVEIFNCPNGLRIESNQLVLKNGGIGLYLNNSNGLANNRALVANNSISVLGSISKTGILINSSSYFDVVFNSVLVKGTLTTGSESVRINYCSQMKLINNNMVNLSGNNVLAIYGDRPDSDYNNFFGNGPGVVFFTKVYSTLTDWNSSIATDKNSVNTDPRFYSDDHLKSTNSLLDGTGIPLAGIAYDVIDKPRNPVNPDIGAYEFSYEPADVGVSTLKSPKSGCGHEKYISVEVTNYGGLPQSGFDLSFSLNGVDIITENIGDTVIQPGKSIIYTFSKIIDISRPGTYRVKAFTSLNGDRQHANDTIEVSDINIYRPVTTEKWIMNPEDKKADLNPDVYFSYNGISNATYYNIHIWDVNDSLSYSLRDTGLVSRDYKRKLDYGKTYKWQVAAKNLCYEQKSPVQSFKIRDLPDLIVEEVKAPASAFSGQSIDVSWDTRNIGTGPTLSTSWSEMIYLSSDQSLDLEVDKNIGLAGNFSTLDPGGEYKQTVKINIPQGYSGKYYLIINADPYNSLNEISDTNNFGVSSNVITITLTPPPDLQVTSLIVPQHAFSGEVIDFTYKVSNIGSGETVADLWSDKVLLSKDEVYTGVGTLLTGRIHKGRLKTDSSYSVTTSVRLPEGISGKYFIYVLTDEYNQVYEHAHEGNNWSKSDSVNVIMKPPADFVVSKIRVPVSANLSDTVTVFWSVTNMGGETPDHVSEWYDHLYLVTSKESPIGNIKPLVLSRQRKRPSSGESYTDSAKVILKPTSGNYFIYVATDATNKVFEFESEDNNSRWSDTIKMLKPDLKPKNVSAPDNAMSADEVEISWSLSNIGKGKLKSQIIEDKIWISKSPVFDSATANLIEVLAIKSVINSGDSLLRSSKIHLPSGSSGTCYLYIRTNSSQKVLEETLVNNTSAGVPIHVTLSPWADLVPLNEDLNDTLQMGIFESMSYTVRNTGLAETRSDSWTDYIYISPEQEFSASSVLVKEVSHQGKLLPGSSYSVNTRFKIPSDYKRGYSYIHLMTDGKNQEYEHTAENNNAIISKPVYVKAYPPVNLAAESAFVEGVMASGKQVNVLWTIRNKGEAPTPRGVWSDAIYISLDTIFNETDIRLAEVKHDGILDANEFYQGKSSVQLPHGISGLFYFIIITDIKGNLSDTNPLDNIVFASDTTGPNSGSKYAAFNISLTPSADLQITNVNVPDNFIPGQYFNMSITITNIGKGETIKSSWTNEVYLSPDSLYSKDDKYVSNAYHNGKLKTGESKICNFVGSLPMVDLINYYLIFKTDATNQEPEYEGEENNTVAVKINQVLLPPSDLIVTAVLIPETIKSGQNVTYEWILQNAGSNTARGYVTDAGYFSKDTIWDSNDLPVFSSGSNINLEKQGFLSRRATIDVPGINPAEYYLLVRTDINNKVFEENDTNNTGRSAGRMKVEIPQIRIGDTLQQKGRNEERLFYSIEVPENLEGESLLLILKGDSVNGNNEMYVSHEAVPTRVVHDFAFGTPFSGNQEIVIPTVKAGIYYVYVHVSSTSGMQQNISLHASILNFEIRSLHSSEGGNNGKVTILAGGSKFDPSMSFHLIRGRDSLAAEKVMYINPTKAYVTFDLTGALPAYYDLVAINMQRDTAIIRNGFQVIEGGRPDLITYINAPGGVRGRRIVPVTIEFINNGDVDMENAVVYISCKGGAPVAATDKELKDAGTTLSVLLSEEGGPQGLVRPGARGSITVYTQSSGYLNFIIKAPGVNIVNK